MYEARAGLGWPPGRPRAVLACSCRLLREHVRSHGYTRGGASALRASPLAMLPQGTGLSLQSRAWATASLAPWVRTEPLLSLTARDMQATSQAACCHFKAVLKREYPQGVDVVYESVGGAMFDLAVDAMATKGRLIVIGFISGYQTPSGLSPVKAGTLPAKLLKKSASVQGFFLNHYLSEYRAAVDHLLKMYDSGDLICGVNLGDLSSEGRFTGLESVFRAVDYMYMGKNTGKIVVELPHSVNSKL